MTVLSHHRLFCTGDPCPYHGSPEAVRRLHEPRERVGVMTVEEASATYRDLWRTAEQLDCWCRDDHGGAQCGSWFWLDVEAASIALDLALAEASRERTRQSVAYA